MFNELCLWIRITEFEIIFTVNFLYRRWRRKEMVPTAKSPREPRRRLKRQDSWRSKRWRRRSKVAGDGWGKTPSFSSSIDLKPISAASSHAHNQLWNQWNVARPLSLTSNMSLSWFRSSPGGRKRSMRMEWNGGSWNTAGPISLLSTNLCQTTSASTTTVGPSEKLNVSDVTVLKRRCYCALIHDPKEVPEERICRGV